MSDPITPDQVLSFWLGDSDDPYACPDDAMERWFCKDEALDQRIRDRFGDAVRAAQRDDAFSEWAETPDGRLALIILLDQFSRNAFRGTADMYAGDDRAVALAQEGVALGFDQRVRPAARLFYYLPLEHAEDLALQERCLELVEALAASVPEEITWIRELPKWAIAHRDVIARFGRFPHRNAILGRESTPEEEAYLAQPDAGF